jgi:peptide/nickel transport system ATP-binding protein
VDRLIDVRGLSVRFSVDGEVIHAVQGISYSIDRRETLGIVGESGCGKTTSALALLGLLGARWAEVRGSLFFHDDGLQVDLSKTRKTDRFFEPIRSHRIALLPQESMSALDPLFRVGDQLIEAMVERTTLPRRDRRARAIELLRTVCMPSPEQSVDSYPHELSGGMRQRALIAMALAGRPRLVIADEPTTALDVLLQQQLLGTMVDVCAEADASIQLITHNLAALTYVADRILVMYAGRIVEEAPVRMLLETPLHPYTQGLLAALPSSRCRSGRLRTIGGVAPSAVGMSSGCAFDPRCPESVDRCRADRPLLEIVSPLHRVACWRVGELPPKGSG